jgi:hypothetical protein
MEKKELLDALGGLIARYEQHRNYIEKARRQAATGKFNAAVIEKVILDHEIKSADVADDVAPLLPDIRARIEGFEAEAAAVAASRVSVDEQVQELELRAAIGELTDEEFEQAVADLRASQVGANARIAEIDADLGALRGTLDRWIALAEPAGHYTRPPVPEVAPVAPAVEAAPVQVDAAPAAPAPVESAPVEPAPVEPAPVEPAPVESAPVDVVLVDAAPVDVSEVEVSVDSDVSVEADVSVVSDTSVDSDVSFDAALSVDAHASAVDAGDGLDVEIDLGDLGASGAHGARTEIVEDLSNLFDEPAPAGAPSVDDDIAIETNEGAEENGAGPSADVAFGFKSPSEPSEAAGVDGEPPRRAYLLYQEGTADEQMYPFSGDQLTIGRGRENDIQIKNDSKVSRYHCKIFRRGNNFYIEDQKSSNGSLVNGELITDRRLFGGEEIVIGETFFRFRIAD